MSTIEAKTINMTDRPRRIVGTIGVKHLKLDLPKLAKSLPTPITKTAPSAEIPRKTRVVGLVKTLASRWPAAFGEGALKPLKIGN
jgi:hypothetical protein